MALNVCVLGSGSSGNCVYVGSDETAILIDAGLSYREICRRLEGVGFDVSRIKAVCVTHEHSDHKVSLGVLHRKCGFDLYANTGTVDSLEADLKLKGLPWNIFETGREFDVGTLTLEPFSVPHDSYDPVGFIVREGASKAGIVTDMGMATGLIRERLKGCRVIVLEANHDEDMLKASDRPWSLKQRISGRQGHLSNRQAAELIVETAGPELKAVLLAHLSADCNRPELALETVKGVLASQGLERIDVKLTYPDRPSDLVEA